MWGSATLTMVASRRTISCAVAMTSRARPRCRLPGPVDVFSAEESVVAMPSMLASPGAGVAGQRTPLWPGQPGCRRGPVYYGGSSPRMRPRAGARSGPSPYASRMGSEHGRRRIHTAGWIVAVGVMGVASYMWQLHLHAGEQRAEEAERTRDEVARRRAMEERLRIARELHDSLTHSISVIQVQAGVAEHLARKRGDEG